MKRVVIAVILLLTVLGMSIAAHFTLMKACDELTADLIDVRTAAEAEDRSDLQNSVDKMLADWESRKTLLHILIHHNLMTDLEISIKKAEYSAKAGNSDEVYAEIENAIENTAHIKESSTPSISNIF